MIDPGHGGTDPGHEAVSDNQLPEKDLTLKVSQKLGAYLTTKLSNVVVSYTRTSDTYPSLDQRVSLANTAKVDYFISIHFNGSTQVSTKGTEVHVNSFDSKDAVKLAKSIDEDFKTRAGRKSRGVKDSNDREYSLQVLKYTTMPSVLVECGFLTNASEAVFVNTEYGLDILASSMFRGIRSYLKANHSTISFEPTEVAPTKKENKEEVQPASFFSVQLMSSKEWIDTNAQAFKSISKEVERVQVSQSGYKYKYFSGKFENKTQAKEYLDQIVNAGFKDAFIVERSI